MSPLKTAVSDARRLAQVLAEKQHFDVHPPVLNARGDALRTLLRETMARLVEADDRVLFYFAGHGIAADGDDGPAGYLVPADADPTDLKTLIPMAELQDALQALPCRHLLLILDCCFSGAFQWASRTRAIGSLMPKRIYKERFDRFVVDPRLAGHHLGRLRPEGDWTCCRAVPPATAGSPKPPPARRTRRSRWRCSTRSRATRTSAPDAKATA